MCPLPESHLDERYLVVSDHGVARDVPWHGFRDILSGIDGSPVRLGYDVHVGFNFPDLSALVQAISHLEAPVLIEPAMIDERESSGRKPFSPTQAYIEIGGKPHRYRIVNSRLRTRYVSLIQVDIE